MTVKPKRSSILARSGLQSPAPVSRLLNYMHPGDMKTRNTPSLDFRTTRINCNVFCHNYLLNKT